MSDDAKPSKADCSETNSPTELALEVGSSSEEIENPPLPSPNDATDKSHDDAKSTKKKKLTRRQLITFGVSGVIALILIIVVIVCLYNAAAEKKYAENLENITSSMLEGGVKAETLGNWTKDVWYNAIWEEYDESTDRFTMENGKFVDDFNDALNKLFNDTYYLKLRGEIQTYQESVTEEMQKLKSPPKKYRETYQALLEYYDAFIAFTDTVINPNGNLRSFSSGLSDEDSEAADKYEKVKRYLKLNKN